MSDFNPLPYRLFFDSSNDAMFVIPISSDGQPQCFYDANARACQLLDYTRAQLLQMSPVDLGDDFNLGRWQATSTALRQYGETRFNASFRSRHGRTIWVEVSVKRVELDGEVLAMAIARDMSRQVEAERALRQSERDLNALLNAHPETVILAAADSAILHCNTVGAERLDSTPDELKGKRILELSPPDIRPHRQAIMDRIARTGQTVHFQDFRNGMRLDHTVTPIGKGPGSAQVAIFSRDITAEFVRHGIENLLGDIDRCILKGGDIEAAAALVCKQLAKVFHSPWVCLDAVAGTPFGNAPYYCGYMSERMKRACGEGVLAGLTSQPHVRFLEVAQLPAKLAADLTTADCVHVALVPVAFSDTEEALLLIGLKRTRGLQDEDTLVMLDHIASRLRVAWGMTQELQQLNLLRQALETARSAVLLLTVKGRIVWCNRALSDAIGTTEAELLGRQSRDFLVDTEASSLDAMNAMVEAGKIWTGEADIRRMDGSVFTALQSVSPVYDDDGSLGHYIVIQEDITARKKNQERIRYLAEHDSLTGLHNRMSLMSRLDELLGDGRRSSSELTLLYLDIDHFKPINDRYGHGAGDQLLVQFGHRIRSTVREEDLVCRLGGDEFVVVLRHMSDPEAAARVAQNVLDQINLPLICGSVELRVGTSIGISTAGAHRKEGKVLATDLLREADNAMYQAKRAGRNRYAFYSRPSLVTMPQARPEPT